MLKANTHRYDRPFAPLSETLLGRPGLASLRGLRCMVSWSGGKDACLAMHQAIACGAQVETLVNMKVEGGDRSRSHGLRSGVIAAQARALGMRLDGVPASVALPHTQWLYEYLGMVPVAVDPLDGDSSLGGDLRRLLARMDCTRVWKSASFRHADCVFADGATLAVLSTTPEGPAGIEIALPSRGHVDIVEKCVLGAEGALHILEWLLNALIRD